MQACATRCRRNGFTRRWASEVVMENGAADDLPGVVQPEAGTRHQI